VRRYCVLLDANVIVDAQIRDLFCRLAEAELIEIRWTATILEETRRTLIDKLALDAAKVDRLIAALNDAFPHAPVTGFEPWVERFDLPDPNDRHVLAAAVHGECDMLVTYNNVDFPDEAVEPYDLLVVSVDDALVWLAGIFQQQMPVIIDRQIAALRRPSMSRESFLEHMAARAPMGAVAIGTALGIEAYSRIFSDIVDAEGESSPQGAVRRLLSAVAEGRAQEVASLVDGVLARKLTGSPEPTAAALCEALQAALEDVQAKGGWGFATAKRVHAPDIELVKLVRAGDAPVIAFSPQPVEAHLFYLRLEQGKWRLVELDGPDPALPGSALRPE
jgi:predicted nucleic acid-binding protein